jgi:beta-N-acetylhexosaminidase
MKQRWLRFFITIMLCGLASLLVFRPTIAQIDEPEAAALALLDSMTPAERVGQIFLVTFLGDSAAVDSDVADLIVNYGVGGVVLHSKNDNITSINNTAQELALLNNSLQRLALFGREIELLDAGDESDNQEPLAIPTETFPINITPVPLFIGTVHEGDGPMFTEIRHGLTLLPNQMAIGATWQPEYSRRVGEITGLELSNIGLNLLIGPSLDVLETPRPASDSDLGTRSFGGDPHWVGVMGQAYTAGIHAGSDGRIGVIAKHFPGYGSSDRPINEDVGTVRKSLEQLKQIELAPFFAVTGNAPNEESVADGLLSAHIRYQGFQGNIRATTAPVSFDPQALATLMALPEFSDWRQDGGLIVSDELGVRAVQRFYDDTGQEFPHRQVAKDALLAGNDLLYLSEFAVTGAGYDSQLANIKDTITWFQDKYDTDQTFRQRIDDAALRILQLKLRLYSDDFSPENVLVETDAIFETVGQGRPEIFDLAQQAVTLISPSQATLEERLPIGIDDRIVIITDLRESQQCSTCPVEAWLGQQALEQRLLALYGPQGSEQLRPERISSFSFAELRDFLTSPALIPTPVPPITSTGGSENPNATSPPDENTTPIPTPTLSPILQVASALEVADWVIFTSLRPDPDVIASDALRLFLEQRPDIVRNAKVIVFAYNAPYYLDTTEISKITAYFGVYSKIDPFVDASVRTLFQESPLSGKSPVNIEGIRYDLFEITEPHPEQVLELYILDEDTLKSPPSEEPLEVVPGATLRLQTGVIVDYNGNPVPDGTLVQFIQQDRIQGFVNVIDDRPTSNGIANLDYLLEARAGNFRITVKSGNAAASQEIDIVIGENAIVSVSTPTATATSPPTATNTPTSTAIPTQTPSATPTETPVPTVTVEIVAADTEVEPPQVTNDIQMIYGLGMGLLLTGGAGYVAGRNETKDLSNIIRCMLWGMIGGVSVYIYFALGFPGSDWLEQLGSWTAFLLTLFGGVVGLLLYRVQH